LARYCSLAHELATKPRPAIEEAGQRLASSPRIKAIEETYLALPIQPGTQSWIARGRAAGEANQLEAVLWGRFRSVVSRGSSVPVHSQVMPADEAEKHTLLWDAAKDLSRENGRSLEWNWLRLVDAFWREDLSRDGLVNFYPGKPGRKFVVLERTVLAGFLLGHSKLDTGAASIEDLRHWRVKDYLSQPKPVGDYFRFDPEGRYGLAIQTGELDRWREGTEAGRKAGPDTFVLEQNRDAEVIAPGPKGGEIECRSARLGHRLANSDHRQETRPRIWSADEARSLSKCQTCQRGRQHSQNDRSEPPRLGSQKPQIVTQTGSTPG
jgi:hypothetical protein